MRGKRVHHNGTLLLSTAMAIIGVALLIQAILGPGLLCGRALLGVLFLAAGCGRVYVELRRGRT